MENLFVGLLVVSFAGITFYLALMLSRCIDELIGMWDSFKTPKPNRRK